MSLTPRMLALLGFALVALAACKMSGPRELTSLRPRLKCPFPASPSPTSLSGTVPVCPPPVMPLPLAQDFFLHGAYYHL